MYILYHSKRNAAEYDEETKLSIIFIWWMMISQAFEGTNFSTLKQMISICWWRSVAFHFVKFPVGIMFSCIHVSHCAIKSELLKEEVSLYQLVYLSSQQSPIYILNVLTLNRDVLRCWSKKFSFFVLSGNKYHNLYRCV